MDKVIQVTWKGHLALNRANGTGRIVLEIGDRDVAQKVLHRLTSCYKNSSSTENCATSHGIKAPSNLTRTQRISSNSHFVKARKILSGILTQKAMKELDLEKIPRVAKSRWGNHVPSTIPKPDTPESTITPVDEDNLIQDAEEVEVMESSENTPPTTDSADGDPVEDDVELPFDGLSAKIASTDFTSITTPTSPADANICELLRRSRCHKGLSEDYMERATALVKRHFPLTIGEPKLSDAIKELSSSLFAPPKPVSAPRPPSLGFTPCAQLNYQRPQPLRGLSGQVSLI